MRRILSEIYPLLLGIVFVIGGLSGQLVLRGTNSSLMLALLGFGMSVYGIIRLATMKSRIQKEKELEAHTRERNENFYRSIIDSPSDLQAPRNITMKRPGNFRASGPYDILLNDKSVGESRNGENLKFVTNKTKNVITAVDLKKPDRKIAPLFFEVVSENMKNDKEELYFNPIGDELVFAVIGGKDNGLKQIFPADGNALPQ